MEILICNNCYCIRHDFFTYNYYLSQINGKSFFFKVSWKSYFPKFLLFLYLQIKEWYFDIVKVKITQSCLTLFKPMEYSVHGILQARILKWVAFPFSRKSSQLRYQTQVSLFAGGFFTSWATRESFVWEIDQFCFLKAYQTLLDWKSSFCLF